MRPRNIIDRFALCSFFLLFFTDILGGEPPKPASSKDDPEKVGQYEKLERFENAFQTAKRGDNDSEDILSILRLNLHLNRNDSWQSQELSERAKSLNSEVAEFISTKSGYPELLRQEILELHHHKELNRSTTHKLNLTELYWLIEYVPAPEVVIMLGSLLEYDDGFFVDGRLTRAIDRESIAARSLVILNSFPLIEPDLRIETSDIKLAYPDVLVPEWQAWWQEILDGERTFQLEGDPNRYNHLGPVSADWKPKSAALTASQPSPATTARTPAPKISPELEIKAQENRYLWAGLALVAIAVLTWVITRFQNGSRRVL